MRGKGGVCMSTGGEMRRVDLRKLQRTDLLAGRKPRTINMIQLGNALNDPDLNPPIKALFCWNADPANCVPDTIAARKGLAREDLFTVVHDTFWSDTTAYADIVLPADTALEHVDLLAGTANTTQPIRAGNRETGRELDNQEMFRRLARAMGYDEPCSRSRTKRHDPRADRPEVNALFEGVSFEQLQRNGVGRANTDSRADGAVKQRQVADPSGKIESIRSPQRPRLDPCPLTSTKLKGCSSAASSGRYPLQVISAATHYFIGAEFPARAAAAGNDGAPDFEVSTADARHGESGTANTAACTTTAANIGHALIVDGLFGA